jgi:hypothetical protein
LQVANRKMEFAGAEEFSTAAAFPFRGETSV